MIKYLKKLKNSFPLARKKEDKSLRRISQKASVITKGNVGRPIEGIRYGGRERLF